MPAAVTPARLLDHIRARRDEFVDYVRELARIESPTHDPDQTLRILRVLDSSLRDAGCRVHRRPGRNSGGNLYAVYAGRRSGRPAQLVVGHCDTVWPVGTLEAMPLRANANRFHGPGVFDMKAGLAQIVFALRTMSELELEPELMPVIVISSDEETGSVESRTTIERLARRCERAFVLEPALGRRGRLKTRRKGTGHYDVVVKGKASHAGVAPEEGVSAILELSHVIQRLFQLNDPERGTTVNVGTVSGGVSANVVAPESRADVDVRVTTRDDAERIDDAIRALQPAIPGVSIHVTGGIDRGPMEATPRNQALWRLARTLGREIGLELQEGMSGGASDGNFTSQYTATLDGLGAVGDGAHAQREYIDIDRTLERCALLTLLLLAPSVDD